MDAHMSCVLVLDGVRVKEEPVCDLGEFEEGPSYGVRSMNIVYGKTLCNEL